MIKIVSYIGLAAGLALLTGLIAWQGVPEIAGLLTASGWALLWVPLIWFPTVLMNARCWQLLFAPAHMPGFWQAFYAQWMGRSVNTLLPVASIGGEIVKARALVLWGTDVHHASAAGIIDKTVQVITVIIWGVLGVVLLSTLALDDALVMSSAIGLALLGAGTAGFLVVQRAGMFGFIVKSAHKVTKAEIFGNLVNTADEIDRIVLELYSNYGRVFVATSWRMLALLLQTGEVWLAAWLLGYPITVIEAVMLKSLSSTLSDAAFFVPNAYGVQEGAFIVLGALIGLSPDVALAISLAIRIREVLIDVPGLVFWQHTEGRAYFRRKRESANHDSGGQTD
jgi:putative membrane protein